MSRLEDAQQRLDAAFSKLDAAIDQRLSEPDGGGSDSDVELKAMRTEKDRLQTAANAVASQLDRTIERVRRLLQD